MGMKPFTVGILSFSDGRLRVHKTLEETIQNHADVLQQAVSKDPLLQPVKSGEIAYSAAIARSCAKDMRTAGIDAALFNISVFGFPNYSLIAARLLEMPVLLSSPKDDRLPGLVGILATHGAMVQIGFKSRKLWGNPLEEPELQSELSAFCRASGVMQRMKGSVYGLIGGRSIGMNTGVPCTQQWMSQFGVDVEHIDQLEIVRRAPLVGQEEVERAYAWMAVHMGRVSTDGKAAPEHVKEQIRHYIALRSIIQDRDLDFLGIKCHYELSEYYVTACLSAMALNDPYDWNGPKEPIVAACEADSDGALSMQILKLISGFPSMLLDVRSYDFENRLFVCCNCGALPSWYAARSDDPKVNLAGVFLEPVIAKYAGAGAHFPFVCAEGEVTVARLTRVNSQYRMFIGKGEFVNFPRQKMAATCAAWPHGFLKMDTPPREFIAIYNSNHAHVVPGDHRRALAMYCEFQGIPVDTLD